MKRLSSSGTVYNIESSGSVDVLSQISDILFGIQSDIAQIITEYNAEVFPTLSTLPQGKSDSRWRLPNDSINPRLNNLDGANLFVDTEASSTSNAGKFWYSIGGETRPKTIKESFLALHSEISTTLDQLRTEINSIGEGNPVAAYNTTATAGNLVDKDVRSIILDGTTITASSAGTNTISITAPGGNSTDDDALHSSVDGEITSLPLKGSPDGADILLIEDSEDNDEKKKLYFSSIIHGDQAGGTLHSAATISVAGFMSAADKTKLDGIEAGATNNSTWVSLSDTPGSITANYFVRGNSGGTALEFYDLFASANTWSNTQTFGSGITMSGGDIIPSSDDTLNVGTESARFTQMRATQGIFVNGNKAPTLAAQGDIGILAGRNLESVGCSSLMQIGGPSTNYPPLGILGSVSTYGTGTTARIRNEGESSMIIGSAFASNGTSTAYIDCAAGAYGSLTGGHSYPATGSTTAVAGILNEASGSIVWGYTKPTSSNSAIIQADNLSKGSLTIGYATGTGSSNLYTAGQGSLTGGRTVSTTPGSSRIDGLSHGSIVWGNVINSTSFDSQISSAASAHGAFAGGYCNAALANSEILGNGKGCIAHGSVENGNITAGQGSLALGVVDGTAAGTGTISSGVGSMAVGSVNDGLIRASVSGSFCCGLANDGIIETITANGGGFASGYIQTGGSGYIRVNQDAGMAVGRVTGSNSIHSNGVAAVAIGSAGGGSLLSSGTGSFAFGDASSNSITSSGNGNLAIGQAGTGAITASGASNCFQFGPGVNTLADSLQIGSAGLRLKGTLGIPGAPQNGDMWVGAGGYVYIRSNGTNCKCVNANM